MEIIPNQLGEGVCLMEHQDEKMFGWASVNSGTMGNSNTTRLSPGLSHMPASLFPFFVQSGFLPSETLPGNMGLTHPQPYSLHSRTSERGLLFSVLPTEGLRLPTPAKVPERSRRMRVGTAPVWWGLQATPKLSLMSLKSFLTWKQDDLRAKIKFLFWISAYHLLCQVSSVGFLIKSRKPPGAQAISPLPGSLPHLEQKCACVRFISEWFWLAVYYLFGLDSKSRCLS